MADDFASATAAAAAGGNTFVMPFALQPRGTGLRARVEDYRAQPKATAMSTRFHLIISDPTPERARPGAAGAGADGYTSFKVFMTYDDLVLNDRQLLEVFDVARAGAAPSSWSIARATTPSAT